MTYLRWCSLVVLVPAGSVVLLVIALVHSIAIVRKPGYMLSTGHPSLLLQERGFTLRDQHCDVLLFGDSTANVGLDPRLITADTGLRTCNIAASRPDIDTLDMLPLDSFLQQNPAPKVIFLQFGPEVFYRSRTGWDHATPYPPMLLLARNLSRDKALGVMLRHPAASTQFSGYVLQNAYFPEKFDRRALNAQFAQIMERTISSNGQLTLDLPALRNCDWGPRPLYGRVDDAWIHSLHRYELRGIAVIVRAAPVPSCDPQLATFQHDLAGHLDGDLEQMPIANFVSGLRHTTQDGSQDETRGAIRLIRAHLEAHEGGPK